MDMYKLKFTRLQNEIFRLACIKVGKPLNQRRVSRLLKVSPTAVSKALVGLQKEKLINVKKDSQMNLNLIELNRDKKKAIDLKRTENLKIIFETAIIDYIGEKFPGSTVILFGSYSFGEDTMDSDIDLAIIGSKEKDINLTKFEKLLEREIRLNFYESFDKIHKHLKENLYNGIILKGGIEI